MVDTGFESARRLSLVSRIGSAGRALLRASRHGDHFTLPVDLWVVLVQPCVPKYGGIPTELRHCEECSFRVVIVLKDDLYDFANHTSLVRCTVDVEDGDHLNEGPRQNFVLST